MKIDSYKSKALFSILTIGLGAFLCVSMRQGPTAEMTQPQHIRRQLSPAQNSALIWLWALPGSGGPVVMEYFRDNSGITLATNDLDQVVTSHKRKASRFQPALPNSEKIDDIKIGPWLMFPDNHKGDTEKIATIIQASCLSKTSSFESSCRRTPLLHQGRDRLPSIYHQSIDKAMLLARNPVDQVFTIFRESHPVFHSPTDFHNWCATGPSLFPHTTKTVVHNSEIPCASLFHEIVQWYNQAFEMRDQGLAVTVVAMESSTWGAVVVNTVLGGNASSEDHLETAVRQTEEYENYFYPEDRARIHGFLAEHASETTRQDFLGLYF